MSTPEDQVGTIRRIKWREAYRDLRNKGIWAVSAAVVATLWIACGVKVEFVKDAKS